jgi:hypothetical protein
MQKVKIKSAYGAEEEGAVVVCSLQCRDRKITSTHEFELAGQHIDPV